MLDKVALLIELASVAQDLDELGKFADSDAIMDTMEKLASELHKRADPYPNPNTSLLGTNPQHGSAKKTEPMAEFFKRQQEQGLKGTMTPIPKAEPKPAPKPKPRARARRATMRDVINTYNSIMKQKGYGEYKYGKELVNSRSWAELNEMVQRHFGLQAGRDYRNWNQMIKALQARAPQVQDAKSRAASEQMKVVVQKPQTRERAAPPVAKPKQEQKLRPPPRRDMPKAKPRPAYEINPASRPGGIAAPLIPSQPRLST